MGPRFALFWLCWAASLGSCADDGAPERDDGGAAGAQAQPPAQPPDPGRGGPPGVGGPCIPPSEEQPDYAGASLAEVMLEGTDNCATGLCLVNHFQGRVTCPFGQDEAELELSPDDPERCRLPFQDGVGEGEAVVVPVAPQLTGRPAADAVYCSCRCAGPDPAASYCSCPEGTECVELVPNRGLPSPYAGSYCLKIGTAYQPGASYGAPCGVGDPDAGATCGDRNP